MTNVALDGAASWMRTSWVFSISSHAIHEYWMSSGMNVGWCGLFCMVCRNLNFLVSRNLNFVSPYIYNIYICVDRYITWILTLYVGLSPCSLGRFAVADLRQPKRCTNSAEVVKCWYSRNVLTIPFGYHWNMYIMHPQFPNQRLSFGKISNDSSCFCCATNLLEDIAKNNRVKSDQSPSQPDLFWTR